MGKYFAGTSGRRARAKLRKGLVLTEIGVSKSTHVRYSTAVAQIFRVIEGATTMEQIDDLISDWIQEKFSKGEPVNIAADALSGIHHFIPLTRKKLPMSWKVFGIWRKYEIPSRAPPITSDLVLAMSSYHFQNGNFTFGALLLLAFHCFLRTGEILQLKVSDFLLGPEKGVVRIPRSKGGVRRNMVESITIEDTTVLDALEELFDLKKSLGLQRLPLWTGSGQSFRGLFYKTCRIFFVTHLNFRCYSLRRGGATAYWQACGSLDKVLLRGRWQSTGVARIYLCDALSQLPALKASVATKQMLQQYLPFFESPQR